MPDDLDAHIFQKADQIPDIEDFRYVPDRDVAVREQYGAEYLERFVLGSLRRDFSAERVTSLHYECIFHCLCHVFCRLNNLHFRDEHYPELVLN